MSTDDRALLEAAARAAGLVIYDSYLYDDKWMLRVFHHDKVDGTYPWAPYHDDGDALRLAVKLRLEIVPTEGGGVDVIHWRNGLESLHVSEFDIDECAATRLAIVRAAAAMATSESKP